jgi:hypothetical protein
MSIARKVLLVSLIVAIVVAFGLLVRGRYRQVDTSLRVTTSVQAVDHAVVKPRIGVPLSIAEDTGKVRICGYGKVSFNQSDPVAIAQYVGALTKEAGARWLSALQDSGNLRARVAGLLLAGKVTGSDPTQPVVEQTLDAVIQLAAGTTDPAVYAMAVSMCGKHSSTPEHVACQRIASQRWVQIDPDNAVPWLLLAGKAREHHDSTAEADAFSHAASAHTVDSYSDSLYAFAEPEMPQDVTPLERSYLATEIIGVEAAVGSPQYAAASEHCSVDAMQDAEVHQQCEALAELLVTKGTTLLDLSLGKNIGARAGWTSERVNGLTQELHALIQVIMQVTPSDNENPWSCDNVHRSNAYVAQRARLGEIGAARDALDRSRETVQALAQKQMHFIENIQRTAKEQEKPSESAP